MSTDSGPHALIHVAGMDIERGYEREFERWYLGEHLPRILADPSWLRARRYRCLEGEPADLVIFDLDERATAGRLSAAPLDHPTHSRRVRDYFARTLRRIFALGEDPAKAELINLITVDIEPEGAEAFSRWYNEVHVPEIVNCPGWRGGARYEAIDGDPRFMAIYGLDDAERPFATEEYEAAVGWDDHVETIRGYHGFRIYQRQGEIGD